MNLKLLTFKGLHYSHAGKIEKLSCAKVLMIIFGWTKTVLTSAILFTMKPMKAGSRAPTVIQHPGAMDTGVINPHQDQIPEAVEPDLVMHQVTMDQSSIFRWIVSAKLPMHISVAAMHKVLQQPVPSISNSEMTIQAYPLVLIVRNLNRSAR